MTDSPQDEIRRGERFAFGENWRGFLRLLDDERIAQAEADLLRMLDAERLDGRSFLDIGSGSGLSSLAARRRGAAVTSFDYDEQSVACTAWLRNEKCPGDAGWKVLQGSVLDPGFIDGLGSFDIVYSWGVLHHTGQMWTALDHACGRVRPGGTLFIAIYNDQAWQSRVWRRVKRIYCSGTPGRLAMLALFIPLFLVIRAVSAALQGRNPLRIFPDYKKSRGMSLWRDWLDWLGGYPFEVATPEAIFDFCKARGFALERLRTVRGWGCNEFVFERRG
ncbi:MAG: class I SAM-dependent methyltransferase [Nevskia sp.]|nr:class I SAM-dependent methyltransferase [Nevskia sp.]